MSRVSRVPFNSVNCQHRGFALCLSTPRCSHDEYPALDNISEMSNGWARIFVTPDARGDSASDLGSDVLMVIAVAVVLYVAGLSLRVIFPTAADEWEQALLRRRTHVGYGAANGTIRDTYEDLLALQDAIGIVDSGLTPSQIDVFPTVTFNLAENVEDEQSCAICLESFNDGDCLRVLPCSEKFHKT